MQSTQTINPVTMPLPATTRRPAIDRIFATIEPYLFVLPALVFYAVFLALPIVGVVIISLLEWSGISMNDIQFIGLGNYQTLAGDPVFWQALLHNIVFIGAGASVMVVLGLVLAVLLEQGLRGSNLFRGIFFIPTILSLVVVGIVFVLLLSPELGLVNPLLRSLGWSSFNVPGWAIPIPPCRRSSVSMSGRTSGCRCSCSSPD